MWHSRNVDGKLFLLLPRMLLHRSPRGGPISRDKLIGRFDQFAAGQWNELLVASQTCAQETATAFTRRKRRSVDDGTRRAARALQFVQWGELSSGRQALEGAELAPGNRVTLDQLRRRPRHTPGSNPRVARGSTEFNLDERTFNRNVRSARRGAAGGPSGMTCDHLRPLLDSPRDLHALFLIAEWSNIVQLMRLGWMTALRKKDGVRVIVAGEVIRRLVSRTIAQQLSPAVATATAPYQYALTTRAGCECESHALQAICDLDENATGTSFDGISAYDTISRRAMLQGLECVPGGLAASPFVRLFLFFFEPCVHLGRRGR